MSAIPEIVPIETDVLIIGGGLAGCMAAIKASEYGVKVAIAEKEQYPEQRMRRNGDRPRVGLYPSYS